MFGDAFSDAIDHNRGRRRFPEQGRAWSVFSGRKPGTFRPRTVGRESTPQPQAGVLQFLERQRFVSSVGVLCTCFYLFQRSFSWKFHNGWWMVGSRCWT